MCKIRVWRSKLASRNMHAYPWIDSRPWQSFGTDSPDVQREITLNRNSSWLIHAVAWCGARQRLAYESAAEAWRRVQHVQDQEDVITPDYSNPVPRHIDRLNLMAALPSGKDIMNMFDVSVNRIRHLLLNGMYGKYPTRHVCRRTGLAVKDIALAVDHNWMIGTMTSFPIDLCCMFATVTNSAFSLMKLLLDMQVKRCL